MGTEGVVKWCLLGYALLKPFANMESRTANIVKQKEDRVLNQSQLWESVGLLPNRCGACALVETRVVV